MKIEKIQVDDGFLTDLEMSFAPGMNVVIGGRGTGKTSVIELLRFCLDVRAQTDDADTISYEHAIGVLGGGRVTVTLNQDGERVVASRASDDDSTEATEAFERPAIFSQKEIESLGLSSAARIALVDTFISGAENEEGHISRLQRQIASCTAEIASLAKEIELLDQQLRQLPDLEKQLAAHEAQEKLVADGSKDAAKKQQEVKDLAKTASRIGVQVAVLSRSQNLLNAWLQDVEELSQSAPELESWPEGEGRDPLQHALVIVKAATDALNGIRANVISATSELAKELSRAQKVKAGLDEKIRLLRKEAEGLEKGAGEVIKVGNVLRERIATLKATAKLKEGRSKKIESARQSRNTLLDDFERTHGQKYAKRRAVAAKLNAALGPEIRIEVKQASEYSDYISVVTGALRGSGLKYNELAPVLAQSMSPRELVEAVEKVDVDFVSATAHVPRDRAARLISALRESDLSEILTVKVEDDASLQLLDGKDYKDIQELSVGQRCTVVLPIVLEHVDRVLIVDQPEDHLDNAFIVDTFIKAVRQRRRQQTIFSTHNANIPVLGEAARVFVMRSNGQKGEVALSGPVDQPAIVESITSIMEGGREAFDTRAKFYKDNRQK